MGTFCNNKTDCSWGEFLYFRTIQGSKRCTQIDDFTTTKKPTQTTTTTTVEYKQTGRWERDIA